MSPPKQKRIVASSDDKKMNQKIEKETQLIVRFEVVVNATSMLEAIEIASNKFVKNPNLADLEVYIENGEWHNAHAHLEWEGNSDE